jgi:hypothetical protein
MLGPSIGKGKYINNICTTYVCWFNMKVFMISGPIGVTYMVQATNFQIKESSIPPLRHVLVLKDIEITEPHYLELDGKRKVSLLFFFFFLKFAISTHPINYIWIKISLRK